MPNTRINNTRIYSNNLHIIVIRQIFQTINTKAYFKISNSNNRPSSLQEQDKHNNNSLNNLTKDNLVNNFIKTLDHHITQIIQRKDEIKCFDLE
jgi:hypothetical protein